MLPDTRGYFGPFGGRFVPETLIPALNQLTKAYEEIKTDEGFHHFAHVSGKPCSQVICRESRRGVMCKDKNPSTTIFDASGLFGYYYTIAKMQIRNASLQHSNSDF